MARAWAEWHNNHEPCPFLSQNKKELRSTRTTNYRSVSIAVSANTNCRQMSKWVTHPRRFSDNSAGDGPPTVYNRTQAAIQIERACRGFIGRNKEHRDLLIENNGAFDQWIHISAGNSAKLSSTAPQVNKLIPLLDGFNAGVLDIHLSAETQIRHENQQAMEA
jgi:hypothetical protein